MNKTKSFWYRWLLVAVFTILGLFTATSANAANVNYQALKYGTNETSMASSYYVRPAQVTVSGNQYVVTMTIHTAANLGQWPVTVNSINGQAPQNVSKTQGDGGYNYTYSFTAKSLNGVISSAIYVSIPNVYTANHNISFKFDTSQLPALNGKSAKVGSTQTSSAGTSSQAASVAGANDPQLQQKLKKLNAQAKSQSQAASKKESRLAKKTLEQNVQAQAANDRNQKLFYYVLIGGCLGLVIIIAAATYFVVNAKKKLPRH
ncbi:MULTISPECIES: NEAT domain-containing protein [Lactobacillaceae]|uniref:NEAT domain-containing protein n=1 Tax=Limosilactobacillus alvi TaxID=990412 RepID=A0ABS2ELC7_9LACO|nr:MULTISPECIES: NEAT domain-containing protein [Lactobacillaceae]MBM6753205.1 NEAT domain-containing protein [Limosilactobacillus alvi]QLL70838.1 cell surface protein [Lactobacillus sp. 3B(2020)]